MRRLLRMAVSDPFAFIGSVLFIALLWLPWYVATSLWAHVRPDTKGDTP